MQPGAKSDRVAKSKMLGMEDCRLAPLHYSLFGVRWIFRSMPAFQSDRQLLQKAKGGAQGSKKGHVPRFRVNPIRNLVFAFVAADLDSKVHPFPAHACESESFIVEEFFSFVHNHTAPPPWLGAPTRLCAGGTSLPVSTR